MSAARFQVLSVARSVHVLASRAPVAGGGSWAGIPRPRERGFAWRFLSANNRSLATSVHTSPDVESCLAMIRTLQKGLLLAEGETSRNRQRQWVWRVRVDGEVVATAARSYARQVRARMTCDAFLQLVADTAVSAPVQVMYR